MIANAGIGFPLDVVEAQLPVVGAGPVEFHGLPVGTMHGAEHSLETSSLTPRVRMFVSPDRGVAVIPRMSPRTPQHWASGAAS